MFLGGPADGKVVPGDQLIKINNVAVDDLSTEQAADIIRYCMWHDNVNGFPVFTQDNTFNNKV